MRVPCVTDNISSARADILEAKCHLKALIDAIPEGESMRGVLLYVLKSLNDSEVCLVTAGRALEGCE